MAMMEFGWRQTPGPGRENAGSRVSDATEPAGQAIQDGFHLTLVKGTHVATGRGDVAAEDMVSGDVVLTHSSGPQPVVSVTVRHMTRQALIAAHRLTPVLVRAGALGDRLPGRDLCLHPRARLSTDAPSGDTGTRRAADLVGDGQIVRIFPDGVTYVDLALGAAAVVRVAGIWLAAAKETATRQDATACGWFRIGDVTPDWTPWDEVVTN